jgi:hypothetical protein
MGMKRKLRRRAIDRLVAKGDWSVRQVLGATTDEALELLIATTREVVAEGVALPELVGFLDREGSEARLFTRAAVEIFGDGMVRLPADPSPAGMLLVVTDHDGKSQFQHVKVS